MTSSQLTCLKMLGIITRLILDMASAGPEPS